MKKAKAQKISQMFYQVLKMFVESEGAKGASKKAFAFMIEEAGYTMEMLIEALEIDSAE